MSNWGELTVKDLKVFDTDQKKLVLAAIKAGGVGRIASSGSAMIRNDSGQAVTISRSSNGRKRANVIAALQRMFDDIDLPNGNGKHHNTPHSTPSVPVAFVQTPAGDIEPTIECRNPKCTERFVTEGARYAHEYERHPFRCRATGCNIPWDSKQAETLHHTRVHLGKGGGRKRAVETVSAPILEDSGLPEPLPMPPFTEVGGTRYHVSQKTQEAAWSLTEEALNTGHEGDEELEMYRKLAAIRDILGADPRIAELERQIEELRRINEGLRQANDRLFTERDELKAKLDLIQEAFGA